MTLFIRFRLAQAAAALLLLCTGGFFSPAGAATPPPALLFDLFDFGPSASGTVNAPGYAPLGLAAGPNGVLYGLAQSGGANGDGTVFRIQADGSDATSLHSFGSGDGAPEGLMLGSQGLLYGTESSGGPNSSGLLYRLAPDGTAWTSLYAFSATDSNEANADGAAPTGSLTEGSDGTLYGETQFGGPNGRGTVYKINPDGSGFTVLHSFGNAASDGAYPLGGLISGSDGSLYGTTQFGGGGNSGTVFKVQPDGSGYAVLYQFSGDSNQLTNADGAVPAAALTLGTDGLLYGATLVGGTGGTGVIFQIGTDGAGFTVLHTFSATAGQNVNADGAFPRGALVKDSAGNFYGTTASGGSAGLGVFFRLSTDGSQFAASYSFQSGDGTAPALTAGSDGLIYGTTVDGGANNAGCLFRAGGGSTTHILWDNSNGQMSLWNYSVSDGSYTHQEYGPYPGWTALSIADGLDGRTQVLWDNTSGAISLWDLDSTTAAFTQNTYGPYPNWTAQGISAAADGTTHVLWTNSNGQMSLWNYSVSDGSYIHREYGPYPGWTALSIADGLDGQTRVLWTSTRGQMSLWSLDNVAGSFTQNSYGPFPGWTARTVSVAPDNTTHVLWTNTDSQASLWNYNVSDGSYTHREYGPYPGWTALSIADGLDGQTRVLWDNTSGQMSLWSLDNVAGIFSDSIDGPFGGWTAAAVSTGQ